MRSVLCFFFFTLISLMLPYSLIFFGVWLVMLIVFALTGIPVGPGISLRM
ncbi:AbgT family transporter [Rossellomorea aquimaris]|nr:AbgT family transporter [Rossellomorea aquimaris]